MAVDAFIALGGNSDKSGEISTEKLRAIIKDFGLTIDIDVGAPFASFPSSAPRLPPPHASEHGCPTSTHAGHAVLRSA